MYLPQKRQIDAEEDIKRIKKYLEESVGIKDKSPSSKEDE